MARQQVYLNKEKILSFKLSIFRNSAQQLRNRRSGPGGIRCVGTVPGRPAHSLSRGDVGRRTAIEMPKPETAMLTLKELQFGKWAVGRRPIPVQVNRQKNVVKVYCANVAILRKTHSWKLIECLCIPSMASPLSVLPPPILSFTPTPKSIETFQ